MGLLEGVRVLVVEDDEDSRELLTVVLDLHGASVSSARSGSGGLEVVARERPDVIVCDISLPDFDGYEFLRRARAADGAARAIAVTGHASDEDRAKALAAGYDAHVSKPYEADALAAEIARLTRGTSS